MRLNGVRAIQTTGYLKASCGSSDIVMVGTFIEYADPLYEHPLPPRLNFFRERVPEQRKAVDR